MDCECRFVVCKFKLCCLFTGELVFFVLELHLFAKLHTYCAEGLNPPFYRQPPYRAIPPMYVFSRPPTFENVCFFNNIASMKYRVNAKISSCYFFMFRRLQTMLHGFFINYTFISNTRLRFY